MNFFHFQVSVPVCVTRLFGRWRGPMNPCWHTLTHVTQRVQKSPNMPSSIRIAVGWMILEGCIWMDCLWHWKVATNETHAVLFICLQLGVFSRVFQLGWSFWIDWRPCASPILWFLVLIVSLQSLFFLKLLFAFSFTKLGRYIESGGSLSPVIKLLNLTLEESI